MGSIKQRSTRHVRRVLSPLRMARLANRLEFKSGALSLDSRPGVAYGTGKPHPIFRYGLPFLRRFPSRRYANGSIRVRLGETEFESQVGVVVRQRLGRRDFPLGVVKLGFRPSCVVIEAIQGVRNRGADIRKLNELWGEPWANHLIRLIEEQALRTGYHEVRIRKPETLHYFEHPFFPASMNKTMDDFREARSQVQGRMNKLYRGVARSLGYSVEGSFFVKRLGKGDGAPARSRKA